MDPAWNSWDLETFCLDLLACPRAVNHNVKLLESAFNNSKPKLRPHHLKWSLCNTQAISDIFEDKPWRCFPFLPVKPAPLGGSRDINTSFHLILAAGKGQGRRGFELGSPPHVSLLAQSCFRHRLLPYTSYRYSIPGLCATRDPDGCVKSLSVPPSLHMYATKAPFLYFTDRNVYMHHW